MKRFAACIIVFALLLSSAMSVAAVPAYPGPYDGRQLSGERFVYTHEGDENGSGYFSNGYQITYNHADGYWYYAAKSERYKLIADVYGGGLQPSEWFDHYDPTDPKYIAFMEEYPDAVGYYLSKCGDKRFLIDVPDEVYYWRDSYILSEEEKENIRQMNAAAAAALEKERMTAPKNVAEVWETILALPDVNELILADAQNVNAVSEAYDLLDDEEKDIIPQTVRLKLIEVKDRMESLITADEDRIAASEASSAEHISGGSTAVSENLIPAVTASPVPEERTVTATTSSVSETTAETESMPMNIITDGHTSAENYKYSENAQLSAIDKNKVKQTAAFNLKSIVLICVIALFAVAATTIIIFVIRKKRKVS